MTPATPAEKRAVVRAIQSRPMMFAEIAAATGLALDRVFEVWAAGSQAGKMRIADDKPGLRHIEVVA